LLRYAAPATIEIRNLPPSHHPEGTRISCRRMKDLMRKFVLALALLSSTTAAFAQQAAAPQRQGTEQEQAACRRDVQRHCRSVIDQGDFVVLACLKENRTKISAACDQVLKTHGQ
jgi:Cysteine rich repeat